MEQFPKEVASVGLKRAGESRRIILEEHSASFRWLMASFLAINSGGMFLLGDVDFSSKVWKMVATGGFYIGIVSSLAIAWFGQIANRKGIEPLANLESFWALVETTGEFDQTTFDELLAKVQLAMKARRSSISGWLSLAAFSVGIISIVIGSNVEAQSSAGAKIWNEMPQLEAANK